jgi:hypothetical protein
MMADPDCPPCPPLVIRYARSQMFAPDDPARKPPSFFDRVFRDRSDRFAHWADVRWFSECDVAARTCGGHLVARWRIGVTSVDPFDFDFNPGAAGAGDELFCPIRAIVVNFGVTPAHDACVLHAFLLSGNSYRSSARLPDGLRTSRVVPDDRGLVAGERWRFGFGPCLPATWRPRPAPGDAEA